MVNPRLKAWGFSHNHRAGQRRHLGPQRLRVCTMSRPQNRAHTELPANRFPRPSGQWARTPTTTDRQDNSALTHALHQAPCNAHVMMAGQLKAHGKHRGSSGAIWLATRPLLNEPDQQETDAFKGRRSGTTSHGCRAWLLSRYASRTAHHHGRDAPTTLMVLITLSGAPCHRKGAIPGGPHEQRRLTPSARPCRR
jgi:hypothetical protein